MPVRMKLPPTLSERLAASHRPLVGMWVCSGSALNAEIAAGSGLDIVLVDAEHSPNGPESILAQLQAVAAYPVAPLVRPPFGDTVIIKQYLDIGVQNLLVPMVDSAEQAAELVRAVRYPPAGVRGVGSALARSSRWNRVPGYLADASASISLFVQIESRAAVERVAEIAAVDGVDGILVGPADLAASMGRLGEQDHPEVVDAVLHSIRAAAELGKPAGVNAFAPDAADRYLAAGAAFVLVGADVALLARASEALADRFIGGRSGTMPGTDPAPAGY
jgi:4-hydroxy-2-oxoheptanedioate aldolase